MLGLLFESVTIGGRLVSVKPREDVAPLFAVKLVQSGGPDRGLSRRCELDGVLLEGLDGLVLSAEIA